MGSNDEFGPDTETIRAWLNKRATYAGDARIVGAPRGGSVGGDPSPCRTSDRSPDVTPQSPSEEPDQPTGPDSVRTSRSVLAALGVDSPDSSESDAPTPGRTSGDDTARAVVEALRGEPAPEERPVRRPTRKAAARQAEVPAGSDEPATLRSGRWTEPAENLTITEATTDVDFPARTGMRRILSVMLLAALAASGVASYLLWQEQTTATLGVAAIVGLLTLVIWAARASCAPTRLSIRRGQLSITRSGRTEMVDVASRYTPMAIVGEPGHRDWRVLVERPGMPLIEITPTMVDPHWFTTALFRLRPELRPGAKPEPDDDDVNRAS